MRLHVKSSPWAGPVVGTGDPAEPQPGEILPSELSASFTVAVKLSIHVAQPSPLEWVERKGIDQRPVISILTPQNLEEVGAGTVSTTDRQGN